MELPFYLNFREFEKNYYNNLELWFEEYYNTSEIDFLKNLVALYKPYLSYSFSGDVLQADASVQVKNCFFSPLENYGISFNIDDHSKSFKTQISQVSEPKIISMMEYAQCILDKINAYFQKHQTSIKENESILDYLNHYEIITLKEKNGYCLDYDLHQKTLPFLKAYLPRFGNTVDMSVYSDFYFSVVKIADFIDSKLNAVEAFEKSIYSELKSESMIRIHMRNQNFLTICN